MKSSIIQPKPQFVKKFYFLDYFYILLKSIQTFSKNDDIFESFKHLKHKFQLGESKYRKLTQDNEILTEEQIKRYKYTFEQVIIESLEYKLIKLKQGLKIVLHSKSKKNQSIKNNSYTLTDEGNNALLIFENNRQEYYRYIFKFIEKNYYGIYYLLKIIYEDKNLKNGLMIFPIYSPLKLGIEKSKMTSNKDIFNYSSLLVKQLEDDISQYTNKCISLKDSEKELLNKLIKDGLLSTNMNDIFINSNYNALINRFRKYWLNYFLINIYKYEHSYSTFNIWIERAKQVGIINTTEFYPDFDGRIVYPTSILLQKVKNSDFKEYFSYPNQEKLFVHNPNWTKDVIQQEFVKFLAESYFEIKQVKKFQFIILSDVKEKVCFKMRISGFVFDDFLEKTYLLNLQGKLIISISLEADKLPQETSAMYLKREPILINGKLKNNISLEKK
jgi:hypothetical protein